ncbi:MAG: response regulator transcription factor [Candidatus Eiseniibacteriota bacterium]|jgi:DNA-binding response OmpR family regulator
MARILIVEDEPQMREGLKLNLEYEGHDVSVAADGDAGLAAAGDRSLDLVILDIMLPGCSGIEVLERLRAGGSTTPVIMLTARGLETDKVTGLKLGADDYVTKPFSLRELSARVEAVLRRAAAGPAAGAAGDAAAEEASYCFGDVVIDFAARTVTRGGAVVNLAFKEFELLALLVKHRGTTVSRTEVLDRVWGFSRHAQPETRTVDTHISNLRKKLWDAGEGGRFIKTVHKIGYRFVPEGDGTAG